MTGGVILVTLLYVALSLAVGVWKLRSKDYGDFVAGRNSINKYAVSLSITGTVIGGGMFFAVAQMGYEAGIAVLVLPISYLLGYLLLSVAVPAIKNSLRTADVYTLFDVVRLRMKDTGRLANSYLFLLCLVTFGMYFFMLSAQFRIIADFYIGVLGLSSTYAWFLSLVVIGGTTLIYSVVGGIRKDIATDVFQMVIVLAGLVTLVVFMLTDAQVSFEGLPTNFYNFTGYGVLFPIGVILFFSPAFVGRFDYWQRVIAARTSREAKFSLWFSIPLICFAYVVCCLIGMGARTLAPDIESSQAAVWFISNVLPSGVSAVVILAFYAALMSTSDTLLNVSAVSLTSVFELLAPNRASSLRTLRCIRVMTLVIGLGASLTILLATDAVDLIIGGFSSIVIITPGLLVILLSRKPSAVLVTLSLSLGYASFLAVFISLESLRKYAFMVGFLVAVVPIAVGLLVSLFRRWPKSSEL